ncbi:anti-sigma factor FlgM [Campylobacter iguaniorum]|uniref:flagellar biosynthesis anti-sigma factor FlgM n=1 Tax=Campylobacter iguaniorum TaxID=1244531 RepID=UPI0007C8EF88|nr:flagellar biosynthesis anti-sigma factor FlgM [Campylobacter iguaniorum]ANE35539.1 anti-sigma factor FlgM [Campylobacter iguaniorum]
MISFINQSTLFATSSQSVLKNETKKSESTMQTQSSSESRVDAIKKQINEGTYKIDLQGLASKIADELM